MKVREKDDEILLKKIGERIVTLREERNITQSKLSELCDLERSNMRRLEAGNTNPTVLMLKKICKALQITISDLFNFEIEE